MNSISTKIKVASLIGIATLVSIALYVKADLTIEESYDNTYSVKNVATTNLSAAMKAQARTNEYTSTEYASKMAPSSTHFSEYLALYEDNSFQDNTGGYRRRTAPTVHPKAVKDGGQNSTQTDRQAYQEYGIRSAVIKKDTVKVDADGMQEPDDPTLRVQKNVKRRVLSADGYSRDYSRIVRNAETNDDAYQVRENTTYNSGRQDSYATASAPLPQSNNVGGDYARRRVSESSATNVTPVRDKGQTKSVDPTYQGYAVRSAVNNQVSGSIAQYDNAKTNDQAYKNSSNSSDESYGGYAVRSGSKKTQATGRASQEMASNVDGYARRRAPQGSLGSNSVPVQDYAQTTPANQSNETLGGYAVRSPKQKVSTSSSRTANYAQSNTSGGETYGGYAVRNNKGSGRASKDLATSVDGYARRRAPQFQGQGERAVDYAQYENASRNDYAYKSAPSSEETLGGYAVRSAGGSKKAQPRQYAQASNNETYGGYAVRTRTPNQARAQQTTSVASRPRGGVPPSTGLKIYGSRGERLTASTSQLDRTVIVMPKRGRSITGTVVREEPGNNIIVQSTTGVQSTYRYGEIDAVVTL